jgi:hypothetical protein
MKYASCSHERECRAPKMDPMKLYVKECVLHVRGRQQQGAHALKFGLPTEEVM